MRNRWLMVTAMWAGCGTADPVVTDTDSDAETDGVVETDAETDQDSDVDTDDPALCTSRVTAAGWSFGECIG